MRMQYVFRKRSREESMSSALATQAQEMVRHAAEPIPPGETVKGQLRRSARALGYGDWSWRIEAAWYGRADSWSAAAFEELRARYALWSKRQSSLAQKEVANYAAKYAADANRLEAKDEDFYRSEIARLRAMVDQLSAAMDRAK